MMVDARPWWRGKNPPYWLICGAVISEYGATIHQKLAMAESQKPATNVCHG
jgi:hypothetical protein